MIGHRSLLPLSILAQAASLASARTTRTERSGLFSHILLRFTRAMDMVPRVVALPP